MRFHLALIIVVTAALMAGSVPPAQAQSGEWKQLFDGKDLVGWKHVGPGEMTVEDGLIRTHGGMGLLYWTGGTLGDCVIRVVFKMRDHNDNSGIYIRIPIEPREAWMPVHYGYEVQIDNEPEKSNEDDYHATGTLYSLTKALARPGKPGPEWNTMEITLDGPAHQRRGQRREGDRVHRRRSRAGQEIRLRTATRPAPAGRLYRAAESQRQ